MINLIYKRAEDLSPGDQVMLPETTGLSTVSSVERIGSDDVALSFVGGAAHWGDRFRSLNWRTFAVWPDSRA